MNAALYFLLIIGGILFFLIIHRSFAIGKGVIGEMAVAWRLNKLPEEYKQLHNVILPTTNSTTQIDHIVVSPYGIFVVETKNYKGKIYGSENAEYWTQYINGRKWQFYNPIQQNRRHIKVLQHLLKGYPNAPFYSIIAFSNRASVSTQTDSATICRFSDIKSIITKYFQEKVLSNMDVINITLSIMQKQIEGEYAEKMHVRNAKATAYQKENKIANGICPRCGGNLVRRRGRYGYFIGCSNYPNCKFTKQI